MTNFKFGAKIKLFGEYEINIRPNPEYPGRVEYHDDQGIAVRRDLLIRKLKINNPDIQKMIPQQTRITDLVYDKNTREFEIGIVVETGDDFVLNRYSDIITVDEVSLFYRYAPEGDEADDIDLPEEGE